MTLEIRSSFSVLWLYLHTVLCCAYMVGFFERKYALLKKETSVFCALKKYLSNYLEQVMRREENTEKTLLAEDDCCSVPVT